MKTRTSILINASLLFAVMAAPVRPAAQDSHRHHHYKLIDMETFGGPQSYVNGFEYYGVVQNVNSAGMLTGWADTHKVDPYCKSGNSYGNFCFNYDQPAKCFGKIGCPGHVSHAFSWQDGVRTDLGVLPGGLSSATAWISANGLVAGASQNGETDPLDKGFPEDRAVLWRDGKIIDLGTLEGGYESGAQAVNSLGQVVGWADNTVPDSHSMAVYSSLFNFYNSGTMFELLRLWFGILLRSFHTHRSLMLENLALRQQLAALKRMHPKPRLGPFDKLFWVMAR